MELGKFGHNTRLTQQQMLAAICLCGLFVVVHFTSAATADGELPGRADTLGVSLLAVSNGKHVKGKRFMQAAMAKVEVKKEQKVLKSEDRLLKKGKHHIQSEEDNLQKEEKLLEQEKAAAGLGDTAAFSKYDQKLEKLIESEQRDGTIAAHALNDEGAQAAELKALFNTWSSSVKHPGSKWGNKHKKDSQNQHKKLARLGKLVSRQSAAQAAQAAFLQRRQAAGLNDEIQAVSL